MGSERVVIIIAKRNDVHALAVLGEIGTISGCHAAILDSAEYPKSWSLSMSYREGGEPSWVVRGKDWEIASESVVGLWWRRPYRHRIASEVKGRKIRSFCEDEARSAFRGWVYGLGDRVINPLRGELAATPKPFQLHKAGEAGLRIPSTLITNDPEEARIFLESLGRPAIFKVLTGTSWQFVETRRFEPAYAEALESVRYAPVIFQELIDADLDIRVTVVDNSIFAVSIQAHHPGARLDWRMDLASEIRRHELPQAVQSAILKLMRALGLRFGALDLRLTPDGEYVFLEVNPGGQFLFCEIHAGEPITRALAEALLAGPPPSSTERSGSTA